LREPLSFRLLVQPFRFGGNAKTRLRRERVTRDDEPYNTGDNWKSAKDLATLHALQYGEAA
jgi:hypothetical protein